MRHARTLQVALIALALAGCGRLGFGGGVAVVDLDAVARALERDAVIEQRIGEANRELAAQLEDVAAKLEERLAEQAEEIGEPDSEAARRELQRIQAEARAQLRQTRQRAQALSARYRARVVASFREEVRPYAMELARERGAQAVLASGTQLVWFDAGVDITDEVIAAMRAAGLEGEPAAAGERAERTEDAASPDGGAGAEPATSVEEGSSGTER